MIFSSDHAAPVPPAVMQALVAANQGYAPSYGADAAMDRVRAQVRAIFEAPEAAVCLVTSGTAANALALATLTEPWGAIYCHRNAHVETDECGAPEFYTGGAKLVLVEGDHARIAPDSLQTALTAAAGAGVHNVQRGVLSLTNATEAFTTYSPAQITELTTIARAFAMPTHLDGARFSNALVSLGCSPADLTWRAGIDIVTFGGTKNGLLAVEAVVIFDPARAWEFELRRKRGGHLVAKQRYLAAQIEAYLHDGLWLRLAAAANAMARRLSHGMLGVPGASLLHPTEANAVFAAFPRATHQRAQAAGARYNLVPDHASFEGPPDQPIAARLVCSWYTTPAEVDQFLSVLRG